MHVPFADPFTRLEHLGALPSLVGREPEMHSIHTLLDTVAFNLPTGARAMIISGEMGVGKTRLLAELCQEAGERGFRLLEAIAYASGSSVPYLPIIEALRPLLRQASPAQLRHYLGLVVQPPLEETDRRDEVVLQPSQALLPPQGVILFAGAPLVTTLTHLFPDLPVMLQLAQIEVHRQAELLSPEQEKFRILDAVATILERVAEEQPVLLSVDNLQWIDSASLELLLYLVIRLRHAPIALVSVTRAFGTQTSSEDDVEKAAIGALEVLNGLIRDRLLAFLPLGPLGSEAAARHLHALLPGVLPTDMAQAFLDRAEGNPFFLEELVRMFTLSDQLVLRDGTWSTTHTRNFTLPENIVFAVEQRLNGLSEACRSMLYAASLLGRTFPVEVLALIVQKNLNTLQPLLDEAERMTIITREKSSHLDKEALAEESQLDAEEAAMFEALSLEASESVGSQQYTFCHGIVHEVVRDRIPAQNARTLHCSIGYALERFYGHKIAGHAAQLAYHFALGGARHETLRWSLLAGEEASRQQAHREAIGHFRLAVKLLEDPATQNGPEDISRITKLYVTIGEFWLMLGEPGRALTQFQSAFQRLPQMAEVATRDLVRINRLMADSYRLLAQYDQALAHLQAASKTLDTMTSISTRIGGYESLFTRYASHTPANDRTDLIVDQNDALEHMHMLQSQATLHILLNHPKEAEAVLWKSHQLAIEVGDRGSQAFALQMVGYLRSWGEQIHEAIRLQEQAAQLYIAVGDPFRAAAVEQVLGVTYQALGEMELARVYTQRGLERAQRYGVRRLLGWFHWNQGVMELNQGEWDESLAHLKQALSEAETNKEARLKPVAFLALAMLQFKRGNWQEAEQLFLDSIQAAMVTEWFPCTVALYGHFLAVTGRRTAARVQLDRAASLPEPPGVGGRFYFPFLAEGYLHLGLDELAEYYLENIRTLHGSIYYSNSVDRILGVIFAQKGDWETADLFFEEGLTLCRRARNQPEEGVILYEQARVALLRRSSFQEISSLCEQACVLFVKYDMHRAVAMVDTLYDGARQLEHKPEVAIPVPAGSFMQAGLKHPEYLLDVSLTKRELDVLRLVAEGHTDREVADMLVISHRTVNRHLSNIFVKLDVPGRAAAVACAIRFGLV